MAVVFAARGVGRRTFQIGIAQEFVEQRGEAAATHGEMRVFIVMLAVPGEARYESVDKHVGRAGVEGEDFLRLGPPPENREVCGAPAGEGDAGRFSVSEE